jgi:hypothetical protein
MSRLDSFIARLTAQRACLNWAAAELAGRPGPVLELGLGNGRTYDHLLSLFPANPVYVFDRKISANPKSRPPEDRLILGDFRETLPGALTRTGSPALLAHGDFGDGTAATEELARFMEGAIDALVAPGGLIVADQPMSRPGWQPLPLPEGVAVGRYHIWRKAG